MNLYLWGPDAEIESLKKCFTHNKDNLFYIRSTNKPLCSECKK